METNQRRFNTGFVLMWNNVLKDPPQTYTTFGNLARDAPRGRVIKLPPDDDVDIYVPINVPHNVAYNIWMAGDETILKRRGTEERAVIKTHFMFPLYHTFVTILQQMLVGMVIPATGAASILRNYTFSVRIKVLKALEANVHGANNWVITTSTISLRGMRMSEISYASIARLLGVEAIRALITLFYNNPREFFYQNEESAFEFWDEFKAGEDYSSNDNISISNITLISEVPPIRGMPKKAFFKEFYMNLYQRDRRAFTTLNEMLDPERLSILHFPSVSNCFWNSLAISYIMLEMKIPTLDTFYTKTNEVKGFSREFRNRFQHRVDDLKGIYQRTGKNPNEV
ncbi:MAG: hypothetical protein ACT6FC_05045, partial [Methanosarcinaceae archaeon]